LIADDGTGRATDGGTNDGPLGCRAGHLADDPTRHRSPRGTDDQTTLGMTGAPSQSGSSGCEE
jgi:hypothetical protein